MYQLMVEYGSGSGIGSSVAHVSNIKPHRLESQPVASTYSAGMPNDERADVYLVDLLSLSEFSAFVACSIAGACYGLHEDPAEMSAASRVPLLG